MNLRQRIAFRLMLILNMVGAQIVARIAGRENLSELANAMVDLGREQLTPIKMSDARLALSRDDLLRKMAASIKPGSQWTFHKDEWHGLEVVVLPQVIDSNTGVVTGPEGHELLGSVITSDGYAPNCDPLTLAEILGPKPPKEMAASC